MKHSHWWFGPMNSHVGFQVAFGSKSPGTNPAFEWPLPGMRSIMHLKSRFARQDPVTNDTFIGIRQFVLDVVHQLLQLSGLAVLLNFNQGFPRVVGTARSR